MIRGEFGSSVSQGSTRIVPLILVILVIRGELTSEYHMYFHVLFNFNTLNPVLKSATLKFISNPIGLSSNFI